MPVRARGVWASVTGNRWALRHMLRRRAGVAGVCAPTNPRASNGDNGVSGVAKSAGSLDIATPRWVLYLVSHEELSLLSEHRESLVAGTVFET